MILKQIIKNNSKYINIMYRNGREFKSNKKSILRHKVSTICPTNWQRQRIRYLKKRSRWTGGCQEDMWISCSVTCIDSCIAIAVHMESTRWTECVLWPTVSCHLRIYHWHVLFIAWSLYSHSHQHDMLARHGAGCPQCITCCIVHVITWLKFFAFTFLSPTESEHSD